MKKFLALALSLAMALSLAACGNSSSSSGGTSSGGTSSGGSTSSQGSSSGSVSGSGSESTAGSGAGGSGEVQTFKIGGIGPLTGDAAIYGNAAMYGAEIAVDEINAAGGAIQFEWRAEDDQGAADISVNAYNALKDWGAQAIVGTVTTTPCISVSAEANTDRMFMITPSASSTDVIADKDMMYQVCFTDPNQGIASADYLAENYAGSKVAVIYKNDDAYSQGIHDTFVSEAETKGLEIVYEGTFTTDTQTDFSVQVAACKDAGADVVFLPMYYTPASVILNQASAIGYAPLFFGVDGMDGILTLEGFDTSLAEGVMLLTPFSADAEDELTQNFVATYQEKHGEIPNQFAADGYDAVYVLAAALEEAGCTADMSYSDICEALIGVMPSISVDGLTGSGMTWQATGEVSKAPRAVVIKDGVYVTPE